MQACYSQLQIQFKGIPVPISCRKLLHVLIHQCQEMRPLLNFFSLFMQPGITQSNFSSFVCLTAMMGLLLFIFSSTRCSDVTSSPKSTPFRDPWIASWGGGLSAQWHSMWQWYSSSTANILTDSYSKRQCKVSAKFSPGPPCYLRPDTSPNGFKNPSLVKLQAGPASLSHSPDKTWSHLVKSSHVRKPSHETDNAELLWRGGWVLSTPAYPPQRQPQKFSIKASEPPEHRLQTTDLNYLNRPLK